MNYKEDRSEQTRTIALEIIADERYCNADCAGHVADGPPCFIFNDDRKWDKRRKYNGYIRLAACIDAEIKQ